MEINLLPKKYQQKGKIFSYLDMAVPYVIIAVLAILAINVILGLFVTKAAIDKSSVRGEWEAKQPQYKEISSLKKEVKSLRKKARSLKELTQAKVPFSQVQYILYKKLPRNIWFKKLSFEKNVLNINGIALDFETAASISLDEYVKDLKSSVITEEFPEIKVTSQEMRRVKTKQVLYFNLKLSGADEK